MYAAGNDNYGRVVLWKNGAAQYLTNGTSNAWVRSVFASGNDVYVAGVDNDVATLWKNGVKQNLTFKAGSTSSRATSVFVSDGDVYVLGDEYTNDGRQVGVLWKNGKVEQYIGDNYVFTSSLFVSGNDVYIAYALIDDASHVLLKNGVVQYVVGYSSSIFVSGNDVYVAGATDVGNDMSPNAVLWKNGVIQNLTVGSYAQVRSVFVVER